MTQTTNKDDVKALNSFLRGEISAVETYDQALESVDHDTAKQILATNRASHAERVAILRDEIIRLGGDPEDGSGAWGAFAKAVEGGAKIFGDSPAVAALEEGEDHGLADYKRDLDKLSPEVKSFVTTQLIPKQQTSHDSMSSLKKIMD